MYMYIVHVSAKFFNHYRPILQLNNQCTVVLLPLLIPQKSYTANLTTVMVYCTWTCTGQGGEENGIRCSMYTCTCIPYSGYLSESKIL